MSEYKDLFGENEHEGKKKQNKPVTYVGFIWDHSGSMTGSTELARTNFNEQLTTLKKDADDIEFLVTVIEFDDKVKEVVVNKPIKFVEEMKYYWIGGMTALYDSVARGILKIKSEMEKDIRENKAALIIVMTDGMENASSDYSGEDGRLRLKSLVEEMEKTDLWTFTFMGAGIDESQAVGMGFRAINTMTFDKTNEGYGASNIAQSFSLSSYSTVRKGGGTKVEAFYNDSATEGNGSFVKKQSKTVDPGDGS